MSFFKKMVGKLEDLMDDDKQKEEKAQEARHHEGMHLQHDPTNPPLNSAGQPETVSHTTATDRGPQYDQHNSSWASSGQPSYGAPPAGQLPPLPAGWVAQWDSNSQRYYFLEQATGRTQWEPPQQFIGPHGGVPPPGAPPGGPFGYGSQGAYGSSGAYYGQETKHTIVDSHGAGQEQTYETKEKKSGKGGMLAAGAGGLAAGAVGGALIGHAMGDDSSDDENHQSYQQQPTYVQQTTYYQGPDPSAPPPLEAPPPPSSDHGSVSSSDKEDLAEAREDYENASDASDREEAREEYEEQYEETYGSD
ncbi:MAG: hypothetical protein Q9207_005395 [Kuettlingeria erythrocarpa]